MFDFKKESKEKYYKMAEAKLKKAGLQEHIKIDRDCFGVIAAHGKQKAKVYLKPLRKKGNLKIYNKLKKVSGYEDIEPKKTQYEEDGMQISYRGYLVLDMKEGKR